MYQCPEMIETYLQCGKDTDYNIVQRLAVLDLYDTHQNIDNGKMNAVIRYKSPYFFNNVGSLSHFFALCDNLSLRCVLGLPTLFFMDTTINLVTDELTCTEFNCNFFL